MDNKMIKNIIFDLGGVIITLDHQYAVRCFQRLGLADAARQLDPYTQGGFFGELEEGKITDKEFIAKLSHACGKALSYDECLNAWLAYRKDLPQRNLDALQRLREEGYRLILLSNTNPFMMHWANSEEFDGRGHAISHYFDALYMSYKVGMMKPDPRFFRKVLMDERIAPSETLFVDDGPRNVAAASQLGINTYCPENGTDWTQEIDAFLQKEAILR